MKSFLFAAIVELLALFLVNSRVRAEESTVAERVDRLAKPYIENDVVVGMTIGVLSDGERHAFGFGKLAVDSDRRPDGDTLFEIGSISKVFTGILLGDAVARKEVGLDQPVQELLPDDVRVPIQDDKPIRLWHLATHTSGLPRLPNNMNPADSNNPYADYSTELLYEFLNKHEMRRAPEGEIEYSNLAVGLLGHALARRASCSYEELLTNRLAKPLEMTSTAITLSPSMQERLAEPHFADGTPGFTWDIPTLAGAGAIRSSANDMLKLIAAQLDPPSGTLGEGIELAWKKHWEPADKNNFSMGLGWTIARDGSTRWHNGQTGGYHSMMLVSRSGKAGVVVLSNTATGEVDRLAEDIIRMVLGATVEPRSFANESQLVVAPDVMKRYVGRYELAPNFHLTITLTDEKLLVQATNQPALQVFAKSETEWLYKVVEASLTFKVDDDGRCNEVILHQGGRNMPAKRVDEKSDQK